MADRAEWEPSADGIPAGCLRPCHEKREQGRGIYNRRGSFSKIVVIARPARTGRLLTLFKPRWEYKVSGISRMPFGNICLLSRKR